MFTSHTSTHFIVRLLCDSTKSNELLVAPFSAFSIRILLVNSNVNCEIKENFSSLILIEVTTLSA